MKQLEELKKWLKNDNTFLPHVTASIWQECIELDMFNYQDDWYIKPVTKLSKEEEKNLKFNERILPLFKEILQFEKNDIVYRLLYVSRNMPIKQYTIQPHFDNDVDFDILIKSVKDMFGNNTSGLIDVQLPQMGEIDSIETLKKSLESLPYNFKGIVIYNEKEDKRLFFYANNFLFARTIISKEGNIKEAVYELYKTGEWNNFVEDYPEYKKLYNDEILFIVDVINWLQLAFKRKLELNSTEDVVDNILKIEDISTFLKYEWKKISYSSFKKLHKFILSYQESNDKEKMI